MASAAIHASENRCVKLISDNPTTHVVAIILERMRRRAKTFAVSMTTYVVSVANDKDTTPDQV